MTIDLLLEVRHATVADLDCVTAEDFVKHMIFWELLCLWEKYFIICNAELVTLNKRNELATSCRHANKFLLKNFQPTIPTR